MATSETTTPAPAPEYQDNVSYCISGRVHGLPGYDFAPDRVLERNIRGRDVEQALLVHAAASWITHLRAYPESF